MPKSLQLNVGEFKMYLCNAQQLLILRLFIRVKLNRFAPKFKFSAKFLNSQILHLCHTLGKSATHPLAGVYVCITYRHVHRNVRVCERQSPPSTSSHQCKSNVVFKC